MILEKDALLLRNHVGTAKLGGIEYELTYPMAGSPMAKSSKTGRTYVMDWETIVKMAIEAGVNEEPNT